MLSIASLHVYPIKSLGGFAVDRACTTDRGFEFDRRWMLVDSAGRFLSQREIPAMAQLHCTPSGTGFRVTDIRDGGWIDLPWHVTGRVSVKASVWSDVVHVLLGPDAASAWFTTRLAQPMRLVYMSEKSERPVDPQFANGITSLSDGFPYLVISEASLADLNNRGAAWARSQHEVWIPISMDRFRPNVVVAGGTSFQEDSWNEVRVGDAVFHLVKPCARCIITTTNQRTGERGKEPLRTLSTYRTVGNKVMFGMNAVAKDGCTLQVGDRVHA